MERLEVINLQLERTKKARQIAVGVSQSLRTVEGSAEYAQTAGNRNFCLAYTTGEARLDSKNALLVERAIIGLETKTIPYLIVREELIQNEINQIRNDEKIAGLNTEKLELQGLFQSLSLAIRLPVSVIEARKHAIGVRLQAIDSEINSLNNPIKQVPVEPDKSVKKEKKVFKEGDEIKQAKQPRISEMSLVQSRLLEILETSSKENPLTADQIISFVYEKEMKANPGNAKMLKDRLYVLLPQLRKSMEKRKDQRSILSVSTGNKLSARAYYLEQPEAEPVAAKPESSKPEGMPANGGLVFFQPQVEIVEITEQPEQLNESELAFRIIDKKHAELVLPDGRIIKINGGVKIPFMSLLVERTNHNNPINEAELNKAVYGDRTMSNSNTSVVLNSIRQLLAGCGWGIDGLKTSHTDPIRYYLRKSPQQEIQPESKAEEIKELFFAEEDAAIFMGMVRQVRIEGNTLESYLDSEMIKHGKVIMERISSDGTIVNPDKRAIYEARIKVVDKLLTMIEDHSLDQIVDENGYSDDLKSFLAGFSGKHEQALELRGLLKELKNTGIKDMLYVPESSNCQKSKA